MKAITSLLILALLALTGCQTDKTATSNVSPIPIFGNEYQSMYALEHRLIPRYIFSDNDDFFNELAQNGDSLMYKFWSDVVGPARASENLTEYVVLNTDISVVFITFPTPPMPVACYHAAIIKTKSGYRYLTLEMTSDISGEGYLTAFCEWTPDRTHLNMGPRKYSDSETFKSEVQSELGLNESELVEDI